VEGRLVCAIIALRYMMDKIVSKLSHGEKVSLFFFYSQILHILVDLIGIDTLFDYAML